MSRALPEVHARPELPRSVTVYEVGVRDGLQNEPTVVPVAVKAEFVARLVAAGLPAVELTSFVRPDRVPQLADAAELVDLVAAQGHPSAVRLPVLVPNVRGLTRALAAGVREVAVFASATQAFAERNLGTSREGALEMFAPVVAGAREAGLAVRGYVSMCFGDPWEGAVPIADVVAVCRRLLDLGCTEVSLGDTIGVATPGHVHALLAESVGSGIAIESIGVHFHDTYGQGLANTLAALESGVSTVDASAGGLGGCPFAGSATGNLATEDLIWMLDGLGIRTGVDLDALVETSVWLSGHLGRPSPSRVVRALSGGRSAARAEEQE